MRVVRGLRVVLPIAGILAMGTGLVSSRASFPELGGAALASIAPGAGPTADPTFAADVEGHPTTAVHGVGVGHDRDPGVLAPRRRMLDVDGAADETPVRRGKPGLPDGDAPHGKWAERAQDATE